MTEDTIPLFHPDFFEGAEMHDFVTTRDLKRRVEHAKNLFEKTTYNQYIVFRHVGPEVADSVWDRSISLVGRSRLAYDADREALIVKLVSRPHEQVTNRLGQLIIFEVRSMNLFDALYSFGSGRVRPGRNGKEPDGSYQPRTLPQGRTAEWLSLVVETGYSEFSVKLRADAAWWLLASDGDVRMVIVAHVSPRRPWILIEHWESVLINNCRLGMSRRAALLHSVTVDLQNGEPSASGPFTIPFDRIFLRPPIAPQEHDIVIPPSELETVVRMAWEIQGFLQI